jgi:type II secretion system protein N
MSVPTLPRKARGPVASWRKSSIFLLAGAGLLLLGMLTGFYLFFPAETLRQRIIQEVETRAGVAVQSVQIEQVSLYPLLTFDARGIELGLTGLPHPLPIDALSIAPQWSTLLSADPGVLVQGSLMNGTITAGLLRSGAINARATGLRFDLPIKKPLPFNVTGTLTEAAFDGDARLDTEAKTQLLLRLADVNVLGLELLKADGSRLALGEIILQVEGQGRSMKVKTLSAKGGDFEVNGDGTLLIGRTASSSRIKFSLQVRPSPTADASIASLLELTGKPGPDGFYSLNLSGTMDKPILKPGG